MLSEILPSAVQVLGNDHPNIIQIKYTLAELYFAQGTYTKLERLVVKVLQVRRMQLGGNLQSTLDCCGNSRILATLYRVQGNHTKADQLIAGIERDGVTHIGVLKDGMTGDESVEEAKASSSVHEGASSHQESSRNK